MPHNHNPQVIDTPSGLAIYHQGPALEAGPLPTFIYFALSGSDSLILDPFNQPVQLLADSNFRVFSFTIPGHGDGLENTKAMQFWANALEQNHDVISKFIDQCDQNITFLIEQGLIDTKNITVGGLSRGGFIAAHLAAVNSHIKAILGFAPLTRLSDLEAFHKIANLPKVAELNIENLIPKLIHKQVRFYIGNRDTLVNTDSSYHFIRSLTEAAYQEKIRSPQAELIISPSIGHRGHGTSPHIFKAGVEWLKSIVNPSQEVI